MGFSKWLQDASPGTIGLVLGGPLVVGALVLSALEEDPEEAPVAVEAPEPEPEPATEAVEPDRPVAQPPEPAGPDVLSEAACEHFRNIMRDIGDGVLTVDEIRDKMVEVRESGRFAEEPGIADASTALVVSVTQDDGEAFLEAVGLMDDACGDAGL